MVEDQTVNEMRHKLMYEAIALLGGFKPRPQSSWYQDQGTAGEGANSEEMVRQREYLVF